MDIHTILVDIMLVCSVALLIALTSAALVFVLILLDIRKTAREVKDKIMAIASILDIVSLLFGGMGAVKKKLGSNLGASSSTVVAFAAGLKKALQVLLKK